jgi:hypothetical protein
MYVLFSHASNFSLTGQLKNFLTLQLPKCRVRDKDHDVMRCCLIRAILHLKRKFSNTAPKLLIVEG